MNENRFTPAKPIEPGCKALVLKVHSDFEDIVPQPVRVLGKDDFCPKDGQLWELDINLPGLIPLSSEKYLIRVDDPDQEIQKTRGVENADKVKA